MSSTFLSPSFVIGSIRIGSVESASCINMGNNWPTHFESQIKHNQGFGNISGDHNAVRGAQSLLNDPDFIDFMNIPPTAEIPEWLKEMIVSAYKKQIPLTDDTTPASSPEVEPDR